jgi:hypothetical protein
MRRKMALIAPYLLIALAIWSVHIPFLAQARYSMPLMPIVVVFAAIALIRMTGAVAAYRGPVPVLMKLKVEPNARGRDSPHSRLGQLTPIEIQQRLLMSDLTEASQKMFRSKESRQVKLRVLVTQRSMLLDGYPTARAARAV